MGLEQLWTTFTASLPALKDAWPTVIGLVVIALASGFAAGRFLFGERIENLKSRIARRDEEIADYKAKLHGKSPDEVADRILALERRIAELQPLMLSEDQVLTMVTALAGSRGTVRIDRMVEDSQVDAARRQLVDVFGQAGWHIESSDAVLGTDKKPPNGRTLYLRANINQDWATLVRRALTQAGVSFTERREAVVTDITCPQILLSGPYEPARWG